MAHRTVRVDIVKVTIFVAVVIGLLSSAEAHASSGPEGPARTRVSIKDAHWYLNGRLIYPAAQAEGLLMNVRMVNAVFEDRKRPKFDADKNYG